MKNQDLLLTQWMGMYPLSLYKTNKLYNLQLPKLQLLIKELSLDK